MPNDTTSDEIEQARKLFAGPCDFYFGTADLGGMPPISLPEIAFAGRSNVGKSSLLNALTGRSSLARTSHTPGRTQQLNFFNLGGRLALVDMPGYGYAKVSKEKKKQWEGLIRGYLRGRPTLRGVFVLVDSRHGLKDVDREIMAMLDEAGVAYRLLLTKADEAEEAILATTKDTVQSEAKKHPAAFPLAHVTSARTGAGIAELRAAIVSLCA